MTHLRTLALYAYSLVIVYFSLMPQQELPKVNLWDKFEHAVAYGFLFILAELTYGPTRRAQTLVACTTLGIVMEIGQLFTPGRSCSFLDVVANTTGVGAGLLLLFIWQKHRGNVREG